MWQVWQEGAPRFTMQKQQDTPTHVRDTRLQPTVSGASTRLQLESRDCTILHNTVLHVKGKVTTSEVQQPQDCTSL